MTKDILLRIRSVQRIPEATDGEKLEVITCGSYCEKNGRHYICYDEIQEDGEDVVRSLLKVYAGGLEVTKKGPVSVQMVFEENKKNVSCYNTPYGSLMIGIFATKVELDVKEDWLEVKVDYALDVNYEFVADCSISVTVCSKQSEWRAGLWEREARNNPYGIFCP